MAVTCTILRLEAYDSLIFFMERGKTIEEIAAAVPFYDHAGIRLDAQLLRAWYERQKRHGEQNRMTDVLIDRVKRLLSSSERNDQWLKEVKDARQELDTERDRIYERMEQLDELDSDLESAVDEAEAEAEQEEEDEDDDSL